MALRARGSVVGVSLRRGVSRPVVDLDRVRVVAEPDGVGAYKEGSDETRWEVSK